MSIGFSASAKLVSSDEHTLLYAYRCCWIGTPGWEKAHENWDGEILIDRAAFVAPEIHHKFKRRPSGGRSLRRNVYCEMLMRKRCLPVAWFLSKT